MSAEYPFPIPQATKKELEDLNTQPWEHYAAGWTDQDRLPFGFHCLEVWHKHHLEPAIEMLKPLTEKSSETGMEIRGIYYALKALCHDAFSLIEYAEETIEYDPVVRRWIEEASQESQEPNAPESHEQI